MSVEGPKELELTEEEVTTGAAFLYGCSAVEMGLVCGALEMVR